MGDHDHDCIHEADLVEMKLILKQIAQLAQDTNKTLKGNGKPGLCTEVELIKQKMGWLWKSVGATAAILAGYIIKGLIG